MSHDVYRGDRYRVSYVTIDVNTDINPVTLPFYMNNIDPGYQSDISIQSVPILDFTMC